MIDRGIYQGGIRETLRDDGSVSERSVIHDGLELTFNDSCYSTRGGPSE